MAYPLLRNPRMNVSLYQAAAAMNAQERWQEVIAQNLSAASIPGYRRQDVSFSSIAAGLMPAEANGGRFVIPRAQTAVSFAQGTLRPTGDKLDFGLDGAGFFAVQLPNGDSAYTRDGQFHLDAQGRVVTKQGYLVLSEGGPIQTDPANAAPLTVAATGEISQGESTIGRLRLVEFNDPRVLRPIGGGCFIPTDPTLQPTAATRTVVRQGCLEESNISPMVEMASLLTAMRMFEANQRVLQNQDERMGKAIAELGDPS